MPEIILKPWGREIWIAHTDQYAMKIIEIKVGTRPSLQYHRMKHEHIYIDQGRVRFELQQDDGSMKVEEYGPGSVVEVLPGRKHRVTALEETRILEVSTPQLDDVVRVEDDYGR
jgi:quercetin dioxygenase-like cupin family protein